MARPQTQNGFTRLANELLERLFQAQLTGHKLAIILLVARESYGFGQKTAKLSTVFIAEQVGLKKRATITALDSLLADNFLVLVRPKSGRTPAEYAVQKDWEKWICSRQGQWPDSRRGAVDCTSTIRRGAVRRHFRVQPTAPQTPDCSHMATGSNRVPKETKEIYNPPTPQGGATDSGGVLSGSDPLMASAIEKLRGQLTQALGTVPSDKELARVARLILGRTPNGWNAREWRVHSQRTFNEVLGTVIPEATSGKIGSILAVACLRTETILGLTSVQAV